jgi:hypothetical protein
MSLPPEIGGACQKTLADLVGESLDMQDTHGEQVAGLVGAMQEWLGQSWMRRLIHKGLIDLTESIPEQGVQMALIREAGRGLSDVTAS